MLAEVHAACGCGVRSSGLRNNYDFAYFCTHFGLDCSSVLPVVWDHAHALNAHLVASSGSRVHRECLFGASVCSTRPSRAPEMSARVSAADQMQSHNTDAARYLCEACTGYNSHTSQLTTLNALQALDRYNLFALPVDGEVNSQVYRWVGVVE